MTQYDFFCLFIIDSLRVVVRLFFSLLRWFFYSLPVFFAFFFSFLLVPFFVFASTFPAYLGYVTDTAGVLSVSTRSLLEEQLAAYERQTSNEIAVVIVPTLGRVSIEDYAVRLFEQWKIGKSGKDNGVLLLVSYEDRRVRIEVGYGLEPVLTDGECGMIIRNVIVPRFRNNDFDTGIRDGVNAIIESIGSEETLVDQVVGNNTIRSFLGDTFDFLILVFGNFILFFPMFFIYLAGYMARTKSIALGGILGGIFGFLIGLMLGDTFLLVFSLIGGVIFGLLIDWLLSRNYRVLSSAGEPTDWFHTFGGFGGSRGFGGFGGGSSGGGGASGRW